MLFLLFFVVSYYFFSGNHDKWITFAYTRIFALFSIRISMLAPYMRARGRRSMVGPFQRLLLAPYSLHRSPLKSLEHPGVFLSGHVKNSRNCWSGVSPKYSKQPSGRTLTNRWNQRPINEIDQVFRVLMMCLYDICSLRFECTSFFSELAPRKVEATLCSHSVYGALSALFSIALSSSHVIVLTQTQLIDS